jgi:predicted MPP superfamily phosphohydrolase
MRFLPKWVAALSIPLCLGLASCDKFEFSPNEVKLEENEQDLTRKNIEMLQQLHLEKRPSFRFAVISDTQRFYDELDDVVEALKQRSDIDFVLLTGDITDFGITKEYRWVNERLDKLHVPVLTVIGNHDCQGNGKKIYQAMYGPMDYTVNIGRNRFVFINTNSLEFTEPVPDLDFFRAALKDTQNFDNAFVLSHIAPYDGDFNKSLEQEFARISRESKVKVSIHGHQHGYTPERKFYNDGVDYLIVGSVEKRGYEEITVAGEQITLKRIEF